MRHKPLRVEADVKAAIRKLLDSYKPDVAYEMWVPSGYGKVGLDFNVCAQARALYIEAKAPGKYPTPQQRQTLKDFWEAGAACFIISNEDGLLALACWLSRWVFPRY